MRRTLRALNAAIKPGSAAVSAASYFGRLFLKLAGGTPALPGYSRSGNSNVILPFLSITRNAGNGLPALEMNLSSKSLLLVGENFLRLRRFNRLLQNHLADLEFARLGFRLRVLAKVARLGVEDLSAALRTFADFGLAGEINLRRRLPARSLGLALSSRAAETQTPSCRPSRSRNASNLRLVFLEMKLLEQIRLALGQQFLHLLRRNFLLQNDFAGAESRRSSSGPVCFSQT